MKVTPYASEKDLPSNLLEIGTYDFEVMDATDEISRKGNEMIKLRVAIWIGDKIRCYLFDYLLDSFPSKLRHACDAVGLLDSYQQGTLDAQKFIGRTGKCKVGIEKDKTGDYPDKNAITDYVLRPPKPINQPGASAPAPVDEDLPF